MRKRKPGTGTIVCDRGRYRARLPRSMDRAQLKKSYATYEAAEMALNDALAVESSKPTFIEKQKSKAAKTMADKVTAFRLAGISFGETACAIVLGRVDLDVDPINEHLALPEHGGVYIVAVTASVVKIGFADVSIRKRVQSGQTFCVEKLRLLAWVPGGRGMETQLHTRFKKSRVRGELFWLTTDIADFVRNRQKELRHA